MKKELTCSIVQDLLPNYIEKLTSDETNIAIEEHLETCEGCKEAYKQMIYNYKYTLYWDMAEAIFKKGLQ